MNCHFIHGPLFMLCTHILYYMYIFVLGEGGLSYGTCAESQWYFCTIKICSNQITDSKLIFNIIKEILVFKYAAMTNGYSPLVIK